MKYLAAIVLLLGVAPLPLVYQQLNPHQILISQPTPTSAPSSTSTSTPISTLTKTPSPIPSTPTPIITSTSTFTSTPYITATPIATPTTTVYMVTSQTQQGSTDLAKWSKLGANATIISQNFTVTSIGNVVINGTLTGTNSILAAVCPATPCSWVGAGMTAGDITLWTSNGLNGGNGPVQLSFNQAVSGVGAFIQADAPGSFTAQIVVSNQNGVIGTFTTTSTGTAIYIGAVDKNSSIISATFSLISASAIQTDFVIDSINLGGSF